jgi:hypothetical protein
MDYNDPDVVVGYSYTSTTPGWLAVNSSISLLACLPSTPTNWHGGVY